MFKSYLKLGQTLCGAMLALSTSMSFAADAAPKSNSGAAPVADGIAPIAEPQVIPDDLPAGPGTPPTLMVGPQPVPMVAPNGWSGGWSGAYAPSGSYWYHTPGSNLPYYYADGSGYYGSWNGYWNYGTAWGAPGYTAYWHGWYTGPYYAGAWGYGGGCGNCGYYAGPYWDYAWPNWSHHGWGYSAIGWGHGHWLHHHVLSPGHWLGCRW